MQQNSSNILQKVVQLSQSNQILHKIHKVLQATNFFEPIPWKILEYDILNYSSLQEDELELLNYSNLQEDELELGCECGNTAELA